MIKEGVCGPMWESVFRSTLGHRWGDLTQRTLWLMENNLSGFPWGSYRAKPSCSLTPSPETYSLDSLSCGDYIHIRPSGFHKNMNSCLSDSANDYFVEKVMVKQVKCSCNRLQPHQHPAFSPTFPSLPSLSKKDSLIFFHLQWFSVLGAPSKLIACLGWGFLLFLFVFCGWLVFRIQMSGLYLRPIDSESQGARP